MAKPEILPHESCTQYEQRCAAEAAAADPKPCDSCGGYSRHTTGCEAVAAQRAENAALHREEIAAEIDSKAAAAPWFYCTAHGNAHQGSQCEEGANEGARDTCTDVGPFSTAQRARGVVVDATCATCGGNNGEHAPYCLGDFGPPPRPLNLAESDAAAITPPPAEPPPDRATGYLRDMLAETEGQLRDFPGLRENLDATHICTTCGGNNGEHAMNCPADNRDNPPGECNCGADRTGPSAEAHDKTCPQSPEYATRAVWSTRGGLLLPTAPEPGESLTNEELTELECGGAVAAAAGREILALRKSLIESQRRQARLARAVIDDLHDRPPAGCARCVDGCPHCAPVFAKPREVTKPREVNLALAPHGAYACTILVGILELLPPVCPHCGCAPCDERCDGATRFRCTKCGVDISQGYSRDGLCVVCAEPVPDMNETDGR